MNDQTKIESLELHIEQLTAVLKEEQAYSDRLIEHIPYLPKDLENARETVLTLTVENDKLKQSLTDARQAHDLAFKAIEMLTQEKRAMEEQKHNWRVSSVCRELRSTCDTQLIQIKELQETIAAMKKALYYRQPQPPVHRKGDPQTGWVGQSAPVGLPPIKHPEVEPLQKLFGPKAKNNAGIFKKDFFDGLSMEELMNESLANNPVKTVGSVEALISSSTPPSTEEELRQRIKELEKRVKTKQKIIEQQCSEWAEQDTFLEKLGVEMHDGYSNIGIIGGIAQLNDRWEKICKEKDTQRLAAEDKLTGLIMVLHTARKAIRAVDDSQEFPGPYRVTRDINGPQWLLVSAHDEALMRSNTDTHLLVAAECMNAIRQLSFVELYGENKTAP